MMTERREAEKYLRLTTLECAKVVVAENPEIAFVQLRAYYYVPEKTTDHNEQVVKISREEFLRGEAAEEFIAKLPEGWNLALDSPVKLASGETGHFAMIDLAPRKSPEALQKVVERLQKIVVPRFGGGFLLETNKSYHFLGRRILCGEEFYQFLGANLITSIVTITPDDVPNEHEIISDYRYIGHSLIRGTTGLRITTRGTKTFEPIVVGILG